MKTVAIESPYAGDVEANKKYLQECIRDCLNRGETPYASHQMLTNALDDLVQSERDRGIKAGLAMAIRCDARVFYIDCGWSKGMRSAHSFYVRSNISYEVRDIFGIIYKVVP